MNFKKNIVILLFVTLFTFVSGSQAATAFMVDWGSVGEIRQLIDTYNNGPGRTYVVFTMSSSPNNWFGFYTYDDFGKQRLASLLTAKSNGTQLAFYCGKDPAWPFNVAYQQSPYAYEIIELRIKG